MLSTAPQSTKRLFVVAANRQRLSDLFSDRDEPPGDAKTFPQIEGFGLWGEHIIKGGVGQCCLPSPVAHQSTPNRVKAPAARAKATD